MKVPDRLEPLFHDGLIDEVVAQLKSGKEATVYLVRSNGSLRCAKVYKDANHRSFKQAATYREGRKVKNSRMARAMEKGSRYGRQEMEEAWQNAEVSALYRLADAGVRVPQPHGCFDGVLLMDMVSDANGQPAPRLSEVSYTPDEARQTHQQLIREVVRMLCAGLVHGDLSEYNILVDTKGPVIIDLPQAVDAAGNNHAQSMLERDVQNLAQFFGQFAPDLLNTRYATEIWQHYEGGTLTPDTELSGIVAEDETPADLDTLLREIMDAREEAEREQARLKEQADELKPTQPVHVPKKARPSPMSRLSSIEQRKPSAPQPAFKP
jgi:RIO kinase 1